MSYSCPHVAQLPFPPADGAEYVIEGRVSDNAHKVTIACVYERDLSHTTPFVLEARFDKMEIIRNTNNNNSWGAEEKHGGFPIRRGDILEVKIIVRNDAYQVYINKQFYCDYRHRVGKDLIRNILVDGDISITKVYLPGGGGGDGHHTNLNVPFSVPAHLHPGKKIHISGIPTGGSRFTIYLLHGSSVDHDDIPFCVDIRFHFGSHKHKVIANHKFGGKWGTEHVSEHAFPFAANTPFDIVIKVKEEAYKVTANGESIIHYKHHSPSEHVKHIKVEGEVKLTEVKV